MIRKILILSLSLFLPYVAYGANCGGATPCACGDSMTSTYTLSAILDCSGTDSDALVISGNGLTLDLGGYSIIGHANNDVINALNDDNFTIQNGTITGWGGAENGAILLRSADGFTIRNMIIHTSTDSNTNGVIIRGCNGGLIEYSEFYATMRGIIFTEESDVPVTNTIVQYCKFHDFTMGAATSADGIFFMYNSDSIPAQQPHDYTGCIVRYNEFYGCPDHCIDTMGGNYVTVHSNICRDTTHAGGGGHGLKLCRADDSVIELLTTGLLIHDNVISDITNDGIEAGSFGGEIYNNTICNCGADCIDQDGGQATSQKIINNILSTAGDDLLDIAKSSALVGTDTDYNEFYSAGDDVVYWDDTGYASVAAWQTGKSKGANCKEGDPLLTQDYRLGPGSPCIDAGSNLSFTHWSSDFFNNPRIQDGDENGTMVCDIGSHEYMPPQTPVDMERGYSDSGEDTGLEAVY